MLAILNELRQTLGLRGFLAFLAIAVVSVVAFELITNARGYFEMYIQSQNAQWAAIKAKADAERAASEAEKAKAEAQTAEAQAKFSLQQQQGTAKKAEGEGVVSLARSPYADDLAKQELRGRTAEADLKVAEAAKAKAEKERAEAEAQRAKIGAAKDLVDCKTSAYLFQSMTGQGCNVTESGDPSDPSEKLASMGFVVAVPRDVAAPEKYTPRGNAEQEFQKWSRYVKDRRGFAAWAIAENGRTYGAIWDQPNETDARNGALSFCQSKGGIECRVIATHRIGTAKLDTEAAGRITQSNYDATTNELFGGGGLADSAKRGAEMFRRATASGEPTNPSAEGWQAWGKCAERLAIWKGSNYPSKGAFAVGKSHGCGWSAGKDTQQLASARAKEICGAQGGENCRVIAEK